MCQVKLSSKKKTLRNCILFAPRRVEAGFSNYNMQWRYLHTRRRQFSIYYIKVKPVVFFFFFFSGGGLSSLKFRLSHITTQSLLLGQNTGFCSCMISIYLSSDQ